MFTLCMRVLTAGVGLELLSATSLNGLFFVPTARGCFGRELEDKELFEREEFVSMPFPSLPFLTNVVTACLGLEDFSFLVLH